MFVGIKDNLLWRYGRAIIAVCSIGMLLGFFWFKLLLFASLMFFLFSVYFFRNPVRRCEAAEHDDAVLVCPADGKVVAIEQGNQQQVEGYARKVSIFLSPFDVHVNWVPYAGEVAAMKYKPGAFLCAFLPKSSELNERNEVIFKRSKSEQTILVRQIAGFVARRICWWVSSRQRVSVGHTFGMIRFGSRVEVLVPAEVEILLTVGQRVYGGHTILGMWR